VARAVAQAVDCLITHPNVLNGAQLYWPIANALYVEGYALDQFAAGRWDLQPVRQNRVGLVLDQAIEPELRLRQLQAAEATRATLGLTLTDYVITDAPLEVGLSQSEGGASWGTIANPGSLLRAVEQLLSKAKAEAIAVVARFPDDDSSEALQQYRQGQGVDPIGGAEAVISHLVVRTFQVPCAHAPALAPLPADPTVAPRAAAEELGYTFLPCVLVGLSRSPRYCVRSSVSPFSPTTITTDQVNAVITPASACGGPGLLQWAAAGKLIIAVEENTTTLAVMPETLGISVLRVRSYLEALGVLVCHRGGIDFGVLGDRMSLLLALPH
jgi:hypothetical protein